MSAVSYEAEKELVLESLDAFALGFKITVTYLMVDLLIERLQSVSKSLGLQVFVQKNVLELGDHPIEDRSRDL